MQLTDSLEDKPFPKLSEELQKHTFWELGSKEEHFKYRNAVMQTYIHGNFPVFEGFNHMQYQIREPEGFARMLEMIIETGASVFRQASEYGIRYHGLPEGEDASFFLCKELVPGYLDRITGEYATPEGYLIDIVEDQPTEEANEDTVDNESQEDFSEESEEENPESSLENEDYPGEDVVEIINLQGETTTVYKLVDGRYMDCTNTVYIYDGKDTWTDTNGVEWNREVK